MTGARRPSLRLRLVLTLAAALALVVGALYVSVRATAQAAAEASQDAILMAAAVSIADGMRGDEGGLALDLPQSTFTLLGAMADERVFYRVDRSGVPITGYDDLPAPPASAGDLVPLVWTAPYRDTDLRLAALSRVVLVGDRAERLVLVLGQTRHGQDAIAAATARRAAMVSLALLALVLPIALIAANALLRPVDQLADAVARRGAEDLRPFRAPAPRELAPLVRALNGLLARLRGTLSEAETFIMEAAHRIRTPLSLVRTEAELALRDTPDGPARDRLRRMIRAVEDSSRSAAQILDHATVLFRAEQMAPAPVDLPRLLASVLRGVEPVADMRDITLTATGLDAALTLPGDIRMIEVALRNLFDNAIKYSPPESTVALTLERDGDSALIHIRDSGRGIDPAADLTGRFARGANAGDVVGSGLGLTIVAEVAASHRGRLTLTPRPEGGTCATLALPLA